MFVQAVSLIVVVLLVLGVPIAVQATSVDKMSLRDMTAASTAIVHGTVISSSSHWNQDRSLIVTEVQVQVIESLKGDSEGIVIVTQPGGQVGKIRVDVPGAVSYKPGEEAVLFLGGERSGRYSVAGLSQGRFDVFREEGSGRERVRTMTSGGALESMGGRTASLNGFLGEVRRLVSETQEGR